VSVYVGAQSRPRRVTGALGTVLVLLGFGIALLWAARWAVEELAPYFPREARPVHQAQAPVVAKAMVGEGSAAFDDASIVPPPVVVLPPPPASPAEWMNIPRIGVDSKIVDVYLQKGEWPVPKFIVGHLGETTNPGDVGNAVFAGHIQTIALGNVFARLSELEVGDEMTFSGADGDRQFRVVESKLVSNKDVGVIAPSKDKALVTLITCAGRWIAKEQDYDQRRIVVAEAVQKGGGAL